MSGHIHILRYGVTFCELMPNSDAWPEGHKWLGVEAIDGELTTNEIKREAVCDACYYVHRPMKGKPMRIIKMTDEQHNILTEMIIDRMDSPDDKVQEVLELLRHPVKEVPSALYDAIQMLAKAMERVATQYGQVNEVKNPHLTDDFSDGYPFKAPFDDMVSHVFVWAGSFTCTATGKDGDQ